MDFERAGVRPARIRGRSSAPDQNFMLRPNRTVCIDRSSAAWADVDHEATNVATGATFGTGFNERHFGWVAGGGVEHMLTANLSARVEYLYYGFDEVTAPAGALGGGPAALDLSMQTVRFGLNMKF